MGKVWSGDGEGEMGKLSMCIREPQRRNGAAMEYDRVQGIIIVH